MLPQHIGHRIQCALLLIEFLGTALSPVCAAAQQDGNEPPRELQQDASLPRLVAQTGYPEHVVSVAISPDGRYVLTVSGIHVRLWDSATGKEIRRFEGHTRRVHTVAFSSDGNRVLSGSSDKTARLWEVATGKELQRFDHGPDPVSFVAFSPTGLECLTVSAGVARLWDPATGKDLRRYEVQGGKVSSASFSADGQQIFTGIDDHTTRLWSATTAKELRRYEGHTGAVFAVAVSPDSRRVLTASVDKTVRLWDAATGRELRDLQACPRPDDTSSGIVSLAFFADGKKALTGGFDDGVQIWDTDTGRLLRRFAAHKYSTDGEYCLGSAAVSPNGKQVITGGFVIGQNESYSARLWDAATGHEIRRFEGQTKMLMSASLSADGRQLVTASANGVIYLWDLMSGKESRRFEGREDGLSSVSFSPDGQKIFSRVSNPRVGISRLWDATTGTELMRFTETWDESEFLNAVANSISPGLIDRDGRYVLTPVGNNSVQMWDTLTQKVLQRFDGHTDRINVVTFSPDTRQVVTASKDATVRLWDVGERT